MSNDPSFIADRLVWRFKKSGAEGTYSKAFQSFPEQVQESVRQGAELGEKEAPAVLYYRSDATWTLLTNARIVWREGERTRWIDLKRVADATVEGGALLQAGGKGALSTLTIVESDGTRHQLELEPGPPFSGFWNAIKAASEGRGEAPL